MLTSIRGLTAASLSAGLLFTAAPAYALDKSSDGPAEPPVADASIENPISEELLAASAVLDAEPIGADAPILTTRIERAAEPIDELETSNMADSGFEVSGNVALVTDYRFRGVSFSDGDPALQGGIDLGHSSGFYIGTWGSTISGGSEFGELELDVYGGWSGDVADGVTFDIGLLYYIYPTGDVPGADTDYFEPYASIGFGLGPASATVGIAYAWDQSSLGDEDNFYIYTDFEYGIPDTPITLTAHVGYTDGVFATDVDPVTFDQRSSFDWGLGASWAVTDSLSLGVNYVDTEGPSVEDFTDTGIFFTLGYSM
ncbi:MAG: TorF family putative porin [Erythrobacter sp.]